MNNVSEIFSCGFTKQFGTLERAEELNTCIVKIKNFSESCSVVAKDKALECFGKLTTILEKINLQDIQYKADLMNFVSDTQTKVDLMGSTALVALALTLNLAYLNLEGLRFPVKFKKFLESLFEDPKTVLKLSNMVDSKNEDDKDFSEMYLRTLNPTEKVNEILTKIDTKNSEKNKTSEEKKASIKNSMQIIAGHSPIVRFFHWFAIEKNLQATSGPTIDKILCAICGVIAASYLLRDTAKAMSVDVPIYIWIVILFIPVILIAMTLFTNRAKSNGKYKTAVFILFAFILFAIFIGLSNKWEFYALNRPVFDFCVLVSSVLIPTTIVVWSSGAYPLIEKNVLEHLAKHN